MSSHRKHKKKAAVAPVPEPEPEVVATAVVDVPTDKPIDWRAGLLLMHGWWLLLALPTLYNCYRGLLPVYWGYPHGSLPHINDVNFHAALTARMMAGGHNAWVPQWGSGAAVLRYYQNFSHVQAALLAWVAGLSAETGVALINAAYLTAFPLALFWCARKMGFTRYAAACAAVLSMVIEGDKGEDFKYLFGLQLRCFTWDGWGLYTQIVAAVWMCVAYGQAWDYMGTGNGFHVASVAIALSWLSHLIVGYGVSLLTVLLVLRGPPKTWRTAFVRWLAINVSAAAAIAYQVVPTLVERHVLNRSVFEPSAYWDSYGFFPVLRFLFEGRLLDSQWERSLPWFTLLMAAIVVLALWRWSATCADPAVRVALAGLVGGFLLFTGRGTFGPLVHLMPFSYSLPFHRFYVQFHFWALIVGGWGLMELHALGARVVAARLAKAATPKGVRHVRVTERQQQTAALVVALLMFALFVPYLFQFRAESVDHVRNLVAQRKDMDEWWGTGTLNMVALVDRERITRPGRAYAGARWNWGYGFDLKFIKWFALWTARGYQISNIGMMWHAMSLLSDHDFYFNESRLDHYRLWNIRYVVCRVGVAIPPNGTGVVLGDVVANHAVHLVPAAEGYFSFVQMTGCYDAWAVPKDTAWHFREKFILDTDGHTLGRHVRTALTADEACGADPLLDVLDPALPRGSISNQRGNDDYFSARVECLEPAGCMVMLRVSYHPHFRVVSALTGKRLRSVAVAPSYIGFRVPQGVDTYAVSWSTPWWSTVLFWADYAWIVGALAFGTVALWRRSSSVKTE